MTVIKFGVGESGPVFIFFVGFLFPLPCGRPLFFVGFVVAATATATATATAAAAAAAAFDLISFISIFCCLIRTLMLSCIMFS